MCVRPISRSQAREGVRLWHSHHKPHVGETLALGGFVGGALVAVAVVGRPVAPALDDGDTWEVTRLAVGPDAPHCAASKLLGHCWRAAKGAGLQRLVSYTRADEDGTCYRAAGWVRTARVRGRGWTSGNKRSRWLPGLYEPSTEVVDRLRWEIGPAVTPIGAGEAYCADDDTIRCDDCGARRGDDWPHPPHAPNCKHMEAS